MIRTSDEIEGKLRQSYEYGAIGWTCRFRLGMWTREGRTLFLSALLDRGRSGQLAMLASPSRCSYPQPLIGAETTVKMGDDAPLMKDG